MLLEYWRVYNDTSWRGPLREIPITRIGLQPKLIEKIFRFIVKDLKLLEFINHTRVTYSCRYS